MSDLETKNKGGMACIDTFSKSAVIVAIRSKQEGDAAACILKCIIKMGKPPQTNYTEDEAALKTDAVEQTFR